MQRNLMSTRGRPCNFLALVSLTAAGSTCQCRHMLCSQRYFPSLPHASSCVRMRAAAGPLCSKSKCDNLNMIGRNWVNRSKGRMRGRCRQAGHVLANLRIMHSRLACLLACSVLICVPLKIWPGSSMTPLLAITSRACHISHARRWQLHISIQCM